MTTMQQVGQCSPFLAKEAANPATHDHWMRRWKDLWTINRTSFYLRNPLIYHWGMCLWFPGLAFVGKKSWDGKGRLFCMRSRKNTGKNRVRTSERKLTFLSHALGLGGWMDRAIRDVILSHRKIACKICMKIIMILLAKQRVRWK